MRVTRTDLEDYARAIVAGQEPDPVVRSAVLRSRRLQEDLHGVARDMGRGVGRALRTAGTGTGAGRRFTSTSIQRIRTALASAGVLHLRSVCVCAGLAACLALFMILPRFSAAQLVQLTRQDVRHDTLVAPSTGGRSWEQQARSRAGSLASVGGDGALRYLSEVIGNHLRQAPQPATVHLTAGDFNDLEYSLRKAGVQGPRFTAAELRRVLPHLQDADAARLLQLVSRTVLQRNIKIDGLYGPETFDALVDISRRSGRSVTDPVINGKPVSAVLEAVVEQVSAFVVG